MKQLTQQTRVSFRLKAMMWEGRRWQTLKGGSRVNATGEGPLILLLELFRRTVFSSSLHLSNLSSFPPSFQTSHRERAHTFSFISKQYGTRFDFFKARQLLEVFWCLSWPLWTRRTFSMQLPQEHSATTSTLARMKTACFVPWQDTDSEPATQTIDYSSDRDLYLYTGFSCRRVCDIPLISCLP